MRAFLLTLIVVLTLILTFMLFSPYSITINLEPMEPGFFVPTQPQDAPETIPQETIPERNERIKDTLNNAERRRESNYPLAIHEQLTQAAEQVAYNNAHQLINEPSALRPLRVHWANIDTIMFVLSPRFNGQDALYHALEDSRYKAMLTSSHFGYTHMGIGSAVREDGSVQWVIVVATAWR